MDNCRYNDTTYEIKCIKSVDDKVIKGKLYSCLVEILFLEMGVSVINIICIYDLEGNEEVGLEFDTKEEFLKYFEILK